MSATREEAVSRSALMRQSRLRRGIQSFLWLIVATTIIGGYWFPLLGFTVPMVMLTAMVGGFFKGRYVCGWVCPRGAFFDRVMKSVSPGRKVPAWLRAAGFRWAVLGLLMGVMVLRIMQNPGDAYHWGRLFWLICVVTTGVGVVLALVYHPRTWCAFCPMGTLQNAAGGGKSPLRLEAGCRECGACSRACPMGLQVVTEGKEGPLELRDCLKCSECQLSCPQKVLHF